MWTSCSSRRPSRARPICSTATTSTSSRSCGTPSCSSSQRGPLPRRLRWPLPAVRCRPQRDPVRLCCRRFRSPLGGPRVARPLAPAPSGLYVRHVLPGERDARPEAKAHPFPLAYVALGEPAHDRAGALGVRQLRGVAPSAHGVHQLRLVPGPRRDRRRIGGTWIVRSRVPGATKGAEASEASE